MNIVPATHDDLNDMLALLEASELPVAGIDAHLETALVARENGKLAGCAAVEVYGTAGLLRSVAVAVEQRGSGLGRRLTHAALGVARGRGITEVYLLTTTAAGFFPRFGFEPIARDQMDPALERSEELRGACPASAVAMRATLP